MILIVYVATKKCYFLELVLLKLSGASNLSGEFVKTQIAQPHTQSF